MRNYNGRQISRSFERIAIRQGKVSLDLQAVARCINHWNHRRQFLLFQPRRKIGNLANLVGLDIVEIICATGAIVAYIDNAHVLGLVGGSRSELMVWKSSGKTLIDSFGLGIKEMAYRVLVTDIRNGCQLFAQIRPANTRNVVAVVCKNLLKFLGCSRIHEHQSRLVASEIGDGIHILVVGGKNNCRHIFLERSAYHRTEILVLGVAVKHFLVHAIHNRVGNSQFAVVVGHPSLYVARIFGKHSHFASLKIEPVRVENLRIALVGLDKYLIVNFFQVVKNMSADAFHLGIRTHIRAVGINAVKLEILIAAIVLHEKDTVVVCPHVASHIALLLECHLMRFGQVNAAYKNVHSRFVRSHKRNVLAVGRYVKRRFFRIAEKFFNGNFSNLSVHINIFCKNNEIRSNFRCLTVNCVNMHKLAKQLLIVHC